MSISILKMRIAKKKVREELKRMQASFSQIKKETKRKPNPNKCIKCKQDAGNNFILVYKKNNELKGKMCISCHHNNLQNSIVR